MYTEPWFSLIVASLSRSLGYRYIWGVQPQQLFADPQNQQWVLVREVERNSLLYWLNSWRFLLGPCPRGPHPDGDGLLQTCMRQLNKPRNNALLCSYVCQFKCCICIPLQQAGLSRVINHLLFAFSSNLCYLQLSVDYHTSECSLQ